MRVVVPAPGKQRIGVGLGFFSSLVFYRLDLPSGPATLGRAGLPRLTHPQPARSMSGPPTSRRELWPNSQIRPEHRPACFCRRIFRNGCHPVVQNPRPTAGSFLPHNSQGPLTIFERSVANSPICIPRFGDSIDGIRPKVRLAVDSLVEERGFEPVWGFCCQVVVFGFYRFFVRSGKAVLRPVACDQVRGARGRGQGTETGAKLGGLPPSVACVFAAP